MQLYLFNYLVYHYSQASFKKLNEINMYNNSNANDKNEVQLNPITINNLNDFYIQAPTGGDSANAVFNLSNFYINHGKYFSGSNNIYNINNNK